MEGPSAATKRGAKAVSRRGAQAEEMRPLTSSSHNKHGGGTSENGPSGKANLPAPPRSGQFLHQVFSDTAKDDHPKRRYRVNLPYRMLYVLAVVFLMIPLIIFLYKESHLHRQHDHFKPQRYVNVKTNDVLSQFSDHAHGTAAPPLTEGEEEESPDEKDPLAEETKPASVTSATEPVQPLPIPSTEVKEETVKDQQAETTVDQNEHKDPSASKEEKKGPESKEEKKGPEGDTKNPTNETSGQKVDGENNPSNSKDKEEETKKRIRRRL